MSKVNMNRVILFVIIALLIISIQPKKEADDTFEILDDFTLGFRNDLWETTSNPDFVRVENNRLVLKGSVNNNPPHNYGEVKSKKLFTTEDIVITGRYVSDVHSVGGIDVVLNPIMSFNGGSVSLTTNAGRTACGRNNDGLVFCVNVDFIVEINRIDDLDPRRYEIIVNGLKVSEGSNDRGVPIIFRGSRLEIDEVSFKPFFTCKLDASTDVIVRDKFSSGSSIILGSPENTVTYSPKKICPDDLGVLVIDEEQGLRREFGTISRRIARGEEVIVPEGQSYWFRYVTSFVETCLPEENRCVPMTERCASLDEEYDTELMRCVKTGVVQEIPTPILLFCNQDSDCFIPQQCNDATVQCVSNQCDYQSTVCTAEQIINFIEVIKTVIISEPEIVTLNDGVVKVRFSGTKDIAGTTFSDTVPIALKESPGCQVGRGEFLPTTREGCYTTQISWGDYPSITIRNGQTIELDGHVSIKYIIAGRGVFNGVRSAKIGGQCEFMDVDFNYDWIKANSCYTEIDYENIFEVTLTDAIDVASIDYKERIALNNVETLNIGIVNNLKIPLTDSGFLVKTSKGLRDVFGPTEMITKSFLSEATEVYSIVQSSDEFGSHSIEATPFFNIFDSNNYINKQILLGYYVGFTEQEADCRIIDCTEGTCQSDGTCLITETFIQDCNDVGCTGDAVCNTNTGVCEKTTIIEVPVDVPGDGDETDFEDFLPIALILGVVILLSTLFRRKR